MRRSSRRTCASDGHYVAAVWDDAIPGQPGYRYGLNKELRAKFAGNAAVYGTPDVRVFDPDAPAFGSAASADAVLTFRNAHNWVSDGNADAYFKAFFDVLKPGGTLGVVDHRAKPGTDLATMKESGYLTEALVIDAAQKAGFVLEAKSEVNANPKDTADHPNGVWTLPPTNDHDAADDAQVQGDRRKRPHDAALPKAGPRLTQDAGMVDAAPAADCRKSPALCQFGTNL